MFQEVYSTLAIKPTPMNLAWANPKNDQVNDFLMIVPLRILEVPLVAPLGPIALRSFARKCGFTGEIVDFNTLINEDTIDEYHQIVRETLEHALAANPNAKLIGISVLFTGVFPRSLQISEIVKEIDPTRFVVMGGTHPSIHHKEIIENCPSIDQIVVGEGEIEFVRTLTMLHGPREDQAPFGLASKLDPVTAPKRGAIESVPTTKRSIAQLGACDFSGIDFQAYCHPTQLNWYNPKNHNLKAVAPISTSRSCPFDCNFCSIHATTGGPKTFRTKTIEHIMEEFRWLYNEKGINFFLLVDDIPNANKRQVMEFCDHVVKSELDISIVHFNGLRMSTLDNESIDAMVEAGLIRTSLPIEHANPDIRNKVMGKGLTNERIYEIATYIRDKHPHVWMQMLLIIGMPEETHETLDENEKMIEDLHWLTPIIGTATPYAGTKLWDQCVEDDLFIHPPKDVWKQYLIANMSGKNKGQWPLKHSSAITSNEDIAIRPYNLDVEEFRIRRQKFLDIQTFRTKHDQARYNSRAQMHESA
jgi:magnesium-protoporphyrin IX monomethyl ester (oxidative) cyclase